MCLCNGLFSATTLILADHHKHSILDVYLFGSYGGCKTFSGQSVAKELQKVVAD